MEVKLPFIAKDVYEGTISLWLVDEGDEVAEGDELVEITTSKAAFKLPAPVSGRLVEIVAQEGQIVKVGETLAIIEEE
ncbi:MAG: biotin/lipoyl-binding protein [Firmicutes bacterium]|nr:biotin/lipoyl-binding protein [Bacillota bacterium]